MQISIIGTGAMATLFAARLSLENGQLEDAQNRAAAACAPL